MTDNSEVVHAIMLIQTSGTPIAVAVAPFGRTHAIAQLRMSVQSRRRAVHVATMGPDRTRGSPTAAEARRARGHHGPRPPNTGGDQAVACPVGWVGLDLGQLYIHVEY